MSRFLHRPMFRRGGSAGEGITSGLRQGYAFGSTGAQRDYLEAKKTTPSGNDFNLSDYLSEAPELPKSQSRSDFLINFGLDLATRSPQGNILQTAAASAREPFKQFQQQAGQEDLLKYKHAQGERQFQLEWYKALNDEEKLKVQEQLEWYMSKGMSEAEALDAIIHRKPIHPEEKKYKEEQTEAELDRKEIADIQNYFKDDYYLDSTDAAKYRDFKDLVDSVEGVDMRRDDSVFIDRGSWPAGSFTEAMDDDGNIILHRDNIGSFEEGYAYLDIKTGQGYYRKGTKLIKIVVDEDIISNN